MKASELKKLIKQAVKEAIQEELKDVLLEAVRAPKINSGLHPPQVNPLNENLSVSTPTPQLSSTETKQKYMDVIGETALSFTSKDVQKFTPQGSIDTTSPNGQLPEGEVGMDQIMNLMVK
jgi:hypothetical protein